MANELSSDVLFRIGLTASIDIYNTDPVSDAIKLTSFSHVTWVVEHGVGATGTCAFTVEECNDAAGTGATAITFTHRVHSVTVTQAEIITDTTAGFTITAGSNQIVIIEREKAGLTAGKPFVRLQMTEGVDSPVTGMVLCILSKRVTHAGDFPDVLA